MYQEGLLQFDIPHQLVSHVRSLLQPQCETVLARVPPSPWIASFVSIDTMPLTPDICALFR